MRFKGFSGPIGSGKSFALCIEALTLAYENRGCVGLLGAPTYGMLRDVTRKTFVGLLEDNQIPYLWRASENAFYLDPVETGGSKVLLRSLDAPERLRGTNLAWFGVDELTYTKPDAWTRLQGRLRDHRAKRLCGFAVWTPKGYDWVYKWFISEDERKPNYGATLARPGENRINLGEDYYEALKYSYDEKFYRQEVLGEYLAIGAGEAYHAFSRVENVSKQEFDATKGIYWSLDFNIDPLCSVIAQLDVIGQGTVYERSRFRVLQEIMLRDSHTLLACEEFHRRVAPYRAQLRRNERLRVTLCGDASGNQRSTSSTSTDWGLIRQWFERRPEYAVYWQQLRSDPVVKQRLNVVNGVICNWERERLLQVDPGCKELIADLEQTRYARRGGQIDDSGLDKSDPMRTHLSDALGYLIWSVVNPDSASVQTGSVPF